MNMNQFEQHKHHHYGQQQPTPFPFAYGYESSSELGLGSGSGAELVVWLSGVVLGGSGMGRARGMDEAADESGGVLGIIIHAGLGLGLWA